MEVYNMRLLLVMLISDASPVNTASVWKAGASNPLNRAPPLSRQLLECQYPDKLSRN